MKHFLFLFAIYCILSSCVREESGIIERYTNDTLDLRLYYCGAAYYKLTDDSMHNFIKYKDDIKEGKKLRDQIPKVEGMLKINDNMMFIDKHSFITDYLKPLKFLSYGWIKCELEKYDDNTYLYRYDKYNIIDINYYRQIYELLSPYIYTDLEIRMKNDTLMSYSYKDVYYKYWESIVFKYSKDKLSEVIIEQIKDADNTKVIKDIKFSYYD